LFIALLSLFFLLLSLLFLSLSPFMGLRVIFVRI
jgi:hypothetical protein